MMAAFRRFPWLIIAATMFCGIFTSHRAAAQLYIEDPALVRQPLVGIEFIGNKVTRPEIILREMGTRPGSPPNRAQLRRDQLRVKGLNLFNRVEFHLVRRDQGPVLVVVVTEKWYILPLPYWRFKDQDPKKPIYGFRYYQRNFRGRDETMSIDVWGGADRGYSFYHINPWMKGTPQLSRAVEFFQVTRSSNRKVVKGLEERASRLGLGLGRRWSIILDSGIGVRFRLVKGVNPLQLASGNLLDRILELSTTTTLDSRDLITFPMDGFFIQTGFANGWVLNADRRYQRYYVDARGYFPLYDRVSLAGRMTWIPGWGSVPPYDWIYMFGGSPVRTVHADDEGRNFYMAALEARFELTSLHYFTWKGAPLFPQYFRNLEYGLGAEVFIEGGDAYNDWRETGIRELNVGYGAGLLLRLPYIEVARLEFMLNPRYSIKEAGFAIKTDISF